MDRIIMGGIDATGTHRSLRTDAAGNPLFSQVGASPLLLTDFATLLSVNALTVLFAFTDFGTSYGSLFVSGVNDPSSSGNATFLLETSQDGVNPDVSHLFQDTCAPGQSFSAEIGPSMLRRFFRLSVTPASSAFVKWQTRGVAR